MNIKMNMKTEARRQAILEVAAQTFQELGYERTTMTEICRRLGGSKETLYNYFPSKEELFFEAVSCSVEAQFNAMHDTFSHDTSDIAESLRHFGERLLTMIYSPPVRPARHLAVAESGRTKLGLLVHERSFMRSVNLISAFLQKAMNQGKLRHADPVVAARHLCGLLESELTDRFLFQIGGDVSADEIKAVTARAIDVFMAAYGMSNN